MTAPSLITAFIIMIGIVFVVPSALKKIGVTNGFAINLLTSILCLLVMILSILLR